MNIKKPLLAIGVFVGFGLGYGAIAMAYPAVGMYGRAAHDGYFSGIHDDQGDRVWPGIYGGEAIPPTVTNADTFINFVNSKLAATHFSQDNVGASFLIQTMLTPSTNTTPPRDWPPTAAQRADWEARIRYADSQGWITWRANYTYNINSFYQGIAPGANPWDDAFYDNSGTAPAIIIRNSTGAVVFAIKWLCANPVGNNSLGPLDPPANYNLTSSIGVLVNGVTSFGNVAEPGDTVTFSHNVINSTAGPSSGTTCAIYGRSRAGYYAIPTPQDTSSDAGYSPPAMTCPPSFPGSATTLVATETLSGASVPANTSICRTLWASPATAGGPPTIDEKCVYVRSKPFARVYGGDVSVGAGVASAGGTCTLTNNTSIVGWNKRGAPNDWSGAGIQYAGTALGTIFDMSTALGAGAATAPTSLSFSNTATNPNSGQFGGNFGSAPCIRDYFQDYYNTKPSDIQPLPASLTGIASGSYYASGPNVTLAGGTIYSPVRVNIYVDGNLYISSGVGYYSSGTWTPPNIPMLRVIVRGNIFVDQSIGVLDGMYVAQPNGAVGGSFYTCTLSSSPFTPLTLSSTLASSCGSQKLVINGAVIAKQLYLLRTRGTLKQAASTDTSSSFSHAEVFNYNPVDWIPQPTNLRPNNMYDSIIALPPVL